MTGQTSTDYSGTKPAQTNPCMWTRRCTDAQAHVPAPPTAGLATNLDDAACAPTELSDPLTRNAAKVPAIFDPHIHKTRWASLHQVKHTYCWVNYSIGWSWRICCITSRFSLKNRHHNQYVYTYNIYIYILYICKYTSYLTACFILDFQTNVFRKVRQIHFVSGASGGVFW